MAKVKGPLQSMTAHGRFGKGMYFQRSPGGVFKAQKMPGSRPASFVQDIPITAMSTMMSLFDYWAGNVAGFRGEPECIIEVLLDYHGTEQEARLAFNTDFAHREDARDLYIFSGAADVDIPEFEAGSIRTHFFIPPKNETELDDLSKDYVFWNTAYGYTLFHAHYPVKPRPIKFIQNRRFEIQMRPQCAYLGATPAAHLANEADERYGTIQSGISVFQ